MDNRKKLFLVSGVVGLVVIVIAAGIFWKIFHDKKLAEQAANEQAVSKDEPVDIVLDFYGTWLTALKSTSTNPFESGLADKAILSKALQAKLAQSKAGANGTLDPVLCQATAPEKIVARKVYTLPEKAQILVITKGKPEQAVVTLNRLTNGWYIDDIACSSGESVPVGEFSFEREGHILKNVLPPLDSHFWHIVFEENNEKGHTAALLFDKESSCVSVLGAKAACNPEQFVEGEKVHVYGQAIESGVEVTRLEFLK